MKKLIFFLNDIERYIIFILGGALGAILNLGITYILTKYLGFWYLAAYIFGIIVNIVFNFFYHRSITFGTNNKTGQRLMKFIVISIFVAIGILGVVYFFTEVVGISYIISGGIAIALMSLVNYFLNKGWVFNLE